MSQPVRVSLVFPRSGQQVFVHVPSHVAEDIDAHPFDHVPRRAESSTSMAENTMYSGNNESHAK